MSSISLRTAKREDLYLAREIAEATWPHTYGNIISPEQISFMLDEMYSETALQKQWEQGHCFWMAFQGAQALGFASYGPCTTPQHYKLHKLYVLPQAQGQQVGQRLIEQVIADLKTCNAQQLQLNVNRHNKALSFYQKMGFKILKSVDIEIGKGFFMNDYIMGLEI